MKQVGCRRASVEKIGDVREGTLVGVVACRGLVMPGATA